VKDYVPLIQTVLWITATVVVVLILRPEFAAFRTALRERLERGGSFKFGPMELGALEREISDVRIQVDDLHKRVSKLFLLAMSDSMYENLRKLADGRFGHFEKTGGLDRELRYLRDIGYVRIPSERGISGIPASGDDLSDFVTITETGRLFVELRKRSTSE
jgi:hypothetical protein